MITAGVVIIFGCKITYMHMLSHIVTWAGDDYGRGCMGLGGGGGVGDCAFCRAGEVTARAAGRGRQVLVGNFPGRALGFAMRKDGHAPPRVVSLPSKSVPSIPPSLCLSPPPAPAPAPLSPVFSQIGTAKLGHSSSL